MEDVHAIQHDPLSGERASVSEDLQRSSSEFDEEATLMPGIYRLYQLYHGPTIEVYTTSSNNFVATNASPPEDPLPQAASPSIL